MDKNRYISTRRAGMSALVRDICLCFGQSGSFRGNYTRKYGTFIVYVIFETNPTTVYWGVVRCMYLLSSGGENYFFNKLLFTLYIRLRARRREVVLLRIRRVWHKQHNQIEQCAKNFFFTPDSLSSTYFKAKVGEKKITILTTTFCICPKLSQY